MKKVFLHIRKSDNDEWTNLDKSYARVPNVGDYILSDHNSPIYHVRLVILCPSESDVDAEVFAVEEDSENVIKMNTSQGL
jgi:hypothetical protein